jgi:hypothetical protein
MEHFIHTPTMTPLSDASRSPAPKACGLRRDDLLGQGRAGTRHTNNEDRRLVVGAGAFTQRAVEASHHHIDENSYRVARKRLQPTE